MKIHKIDINIDNLIADIEKYYRTEYLYLTHKVKKDEYARQKWLKETIVQEYKTFCDKRLIKKHRDNVADFQKGWIKYKNR